MRTVRIALTLALALLIATPLLAQEKKKGKRGPGPGGPGGFDITRLLEKLNLTDDQKAEVKKIRDEFAPKVKEARKDAELTEEQQKARKEAEAKAKEDGLRGQEARKAIQDAVKLTDKQAEANKKLRELMGEQMKKIQGVLTDAQKDEFKKMFGKRDGKGRRAGGEKT